ncbi:hypothetical protein QBC35DRAFT_553952 [Podospora australis]|uniref:Uncharacterized protein n=1 Tax=Podospora australis TaxID=1536484 RepID=A0AAN6WU74_9PEZI|nr:hypothetical protein QBC35DRAFT_553952 [Podospora australis]
MISAVLKFIKELLEVGQAAAGPLPDFHGSRPLNGLWALWQGVREPHRLYGGLRNYIEQLNWFVVLVHRLFAGVFWTLYPADQTDVREHVCLPMGPGPTSCREGNPLYFDHPVDNLTRLRADRITAPGAMIGSLASNVVVLQISGVWAILDCKPSIPEGRLPTSVGGLIAIWQHGCQGSIVGPVLLNEDARYTLSLKWLIAEGLA